MFESYRKGAGRKLRTFSTFLLLTLLAWGSYALLVYGNTRLDRLLGFEDPVFGKQLISGAGTLTEWITWSVFMAVAVFVAGLFGLRAFLNRPKFADLLIETEAELKRVRWAPRKETNRATGVVLYFVFWFASLMFVYDLTFSMGTEMLQGKAWNEAGWGRIVTMVLRLDDKTPEGGS
ncbi:MAG: preprotein translocase subunit SecE [Planctomycetes bacterium]|nr:preprotein translocase subunit SecE [Planctomycetota bacterium]